MMSIGWAIISCGDFAESRGAPGINQAEDAELVAVYSRDQGRGEAFAEKHGAKTAYTSSKVQLCQTNPNRPAKGGDLRRSGR